MSQETPDLLDQRRLAAATSIVELVAGATRQFREGAERAVLTGEWARAKARLGNAARLDQWDRDER